MASQTLYRKWRPQRLADIIGQEHVTRTLLNALESGRVSHAYLFSGPRGTGKTSTARILAKAVNCLTGGRGEPCNSCAMCQAVTEGRALDVIEVDAASNRRIDEIRELRERVNYAPAQSRYKVYIIDEVHMLTNEASNALLKTLEEPPAHVIFILATTEPHKLLPTILSRCQRFDFHRHTQANVVTCLSRVCQGEGIRIEEEALKLLARVASGSLRDALNLLQQANTFYGNEITLSQVQSLLGISGDERARELVRHIVGGDTRAAILTINRASSDGIDLRQFHREVMEYLRLLLLARTGSAEVVELPADELNELKALAGKASLSLILKAVRAFSQLEVSLDSYSTLPLELAAVDCTASHTETKPAPKPAPPEAVPAPKSATGSPPLQTKNPVEIPASRPAVTEKTSPASPTTKENPAAPPAMVSLLEHLRQQWSRMIKEAPDGMGKTPAAALLRSARPISLENDLLTVSFKHQYHREKMENTENLKIAEKIVSNFLGRPCRLRCVYEHENNHLVRAALDLGAQVINTEEP
ncbi:MAG: DNA polymerase III subunit gamma/tau [Dehalococcoidales bacterium]|nr:DNA polymerase III subunit gamma/tau [Dehalococcoidales bacterium]